MRPEVCRTYNFGGRGIASHSTEQCDERTTSKMMMGLEVYLSLMMSLTIATDVERVQARAWANSTTSI